ncbi:conserved hypothetical protein [Thiomonas sp. X19]|uniref:PA0069 family radical SAM protein n=1 Tax=Thiomonas sp. X19 TaxID=1050370 RepID=UPI000B725C7B|nr:PA0069 family radical SAM protein [Thiomonas sp. X19]SCC91340.1 conserved hypothetical protein [Thiomonas sp. X19]
MPAKTIPIHRAAVAAAVPDPGRAALKGRGTAVPIAHRFEHNARDAFDDGWGTLDEDVLTRGEAPPPATTVTHEQARSLLTRNSSPDIPFTLSLNPYRGCEHGCIYCYARPTHAYLDLSPGLDFETRLVAKINAASVLERELARPGHQASSIAIGSITDAYQPIERELRITRAVLQVLGDCAHPYAIITKSAGVLRDLDLIAPAAQTGRAWVSVSITTLDAPLARILEPRAAAPQRRLEVVRRLALAGVPVGVNVAPIIPFINDGEIETIIQAAVEAGARSIHHTVLRLPWEVAPLFRRWLEVHVPERAARVMARVQDLHGIVPAQRAAHHGRPARDYDASFGQRMHGTGPWADLIRQRIAKASARAGLRAGGLTALDCSAFRPPCSVRAVDARQGMLF